MTKVVEALVGVAGEVQLLEPVSLAAPRRAFVIIMDDDGIPASGDALLPGSSTGPDSDMSEIEEMVAWARLQSEK
ncbi:MAG: hypothetical protein FJ271_05240 [Planctomycetes bacterium]|nr:hypothetical protein [Planctomycetota bacterium]